MSSMESEISTITELAREFEITPRAIRFYEDKGLLSPQRRGQNRIYNKKDKIRLDLIVKGKRIGLTLAEIKDILDLYELEDGAVTQFRFAINRFKERIVEFEKQKQDIDATISDLRSGIAQLEGLLAKKLDEQNRPEKPGLIGFGLDSTSLEIEQ